MRYANAEFGFSLEVPDDWGRTYLIPFFVATGGKVAFSPAQRGQRGQWGSLNVAVATKGFIHDRSQRERQAVLFKKTTNFLHLKWGQKVYTLRTTLGNESNTAWVETKTVERDGTIKSVDGLVEAVRSRVAYTVQYGYTHDMQSHVTSMLASFRFD